MLIIVHILLNIKTFTIMNREQIIQEELAYLKLVKENLNNLDKK